MALPRKRLPAADALVLSPVERQRLCEQIARRLLAQIRERRLRPGDPLPTERALTQSFRVGRSSVREALRILESKGLITPAGKGVFVVADYGNPLNSSLDLLLALEETNLRELFEVRKILEVELAGRAARRRTPEHLQAMAEAIEEMSAGLTSQERYIAADLRFHLTVAAATGNRIAERMMNAVRTPLQQALASIYHIPGSPQRSILQHRQILEAIRAGDAEGARRRMREHLMRVESDIRTILDGGHESTRAVRPEGQEVGG